MTFDYTIFMADRNVVAELKEGSFVVGKSFLKVFGFFILLHVTLFLWLRMYPFIDLSFHLAAATIYRHINDADNFFKDFYVVDAFLKPNTFHMWLCSLPIFPDVETGNKAFYALYIILLPLSVFLILKEISGNIWTSFLSLLLLYNYNTLFGFVGYTFAIPVVMLLFFYFIKSLRTHAVLDYMAATLLLMSLFFMHALVTVYAIAVVGVGIIICNRKSPVKILRGALVLIPTILLMVYWWSSTQKESDTIGFLLDYYQKEYIPEIFRRINFLYLDNLNLYKGIAGNVVAIFFSLSIFIPLGYSLFKNRKKIIPSLEDNRILFLWLLFLSAFAGHFLLPSYIPPDEVIIYERFSVFLALASIILLGIYFPKVHNNKMMYLAVTVSLLHFVLWGDFYLSFEKENKFFTKEIFPENPGKLRLAGFIKDYYFRRVHCYIMYPDYFITWRKGIGATSATDYRFGAVRRKVPYDLLPKFDHWMVKNNKYNGEYDQVEYLLTKGKLPPAFVKGLEKYHLEKESGTWQLWKR